MEKYVDISSGIDNMIDAILYSKITDAKKACIVLKVQKTVDRPLQINNLDLACLIANF